MVIFAVEIIKSETHISFIMNKTIRTLTVIYNTEISNREIPLFRGAVLKSLGDKANVLYHNHTDEESYRYSYPLIQYKRINGKAAITCVEDGADIIGQFLAETSEPLMLGDRETTFEVGKVLPEKVDVGICETPVSYSLQNWLPLNSRNYGQYKDTESLVEKIQILERVLVGNILSLLKGVGIRLDEKFELNITDITNQKLTTYKKVKLMAFDIEFKANITLPSYIGIGKNASIGNGVLMKQF